MIVISIDPGTSTGWAVWDVLARRFRELRTTTITAAMFDLRDNYCAEGMRPDLVMFEDARKMRIGGGRTFGQKNRLQGVGSVKRDCAIWAEFLDALAIPYVATPPILGGTKWKAETFNTMTGYTGKTSNHARDAGVRAYSLNAAMVRAMIEEWRFRRLAAHPPKRTVHGPPPRSRA